jgi:hypothetical protein
MATINYIELAKKWNSDHGWNTDDGELSSLGEELGLPFAAKAQLNDDQVTQLKTAFEQIKKGISQPTIPQLQPALEAEGQGIQSVGDTAPTATQGETLNDSHLESAYQGLSNANAAQIAQSKQLFASRMQRIADVGYQKGVEETIFGETHRIAGAMDATNALAISQDRQLVTLANDQAEILAQGADFLKSYPNHAQSYAQTPAKPVTIAPKSLAVTKKLSEL